MDRLLMALGDSYEGVLLDAEYKESHCEETQQVL